MADKWGNVVSATQTLGNSFGSRIMPEGTGIWLNNSLAYCTFEPKGNPMDAFAGRHKLSGDCPTIIFRNGKPWVAIGTPGGHTIGQTVPQMVMNLIDFGMNIQDALEAPRVRHLEEMEIILEDPLKSQVSNELERRGHRILEDDFQTNQFGGGQGIIVDPDSGVLLGGSDPRKDGCALGY